MTLFPHQKLERFPRIEGERFGRNQMLFDLGYSDNMTTPEVRRAIKEIDSVFDLVLVTEYLDESMVLLRHLLCWSLDDIVVFAKNARWTKLKKPIDPQLRHKLRELNSADVLLYEYFLEGHQRRVKKFGERRMAEEVSQLQTLRQNYMADCQMVQTVGSHHQLAEFLEWNNRMTAAYVPGNLDNEHCRLLSWPESTFLYNLRERQNERIAALSQGK